MPAARELCARCRKYYAAPGRTTCRFHMPPGRPTVTHPKVPHYSTFLTAERRWSDWAADHLVLAFGSVWTVWVFLVYPLLALVFPPNVQNIVFFISSGWIQLWALPLLNYTANKADKVRTAKAEADHVALTHVATQADSTRMLVAALADNLGIDPDTGEHRLPRPRM